VLGLTLSDIGRSPGAILAGVDNLDQLCAQVIADGLSCRRETRHGDRSFLLRIAPYTESNSPPVGAVLTFTNVTAFRASIDQAIYDREYTKAILNTVNDPLVVLDAELRVQTANRSFYAMFGVSRDETQGVSIRTLGNDEWQTSEVWKSIETALHGHTQFQAVEIDREFPATGRRTIVLDARRLARDQGDALILLTFEDVTERKQAERTTSLLAAIVDSSDDAIVSKNLDGVVMSWNSGAERMFGYKAHEAVGRHISFIIPSDRPDEMTDILRRIRNGEALNHFETVRMRKDGARLHISATISPIKDAAGRVIGASKVARDITERKRAEEALRHSEERFRILAESLDREVKARTLELEDRNADLLMKSEQLRELSWRLLRTQDEERRHIARELHDSAGQTLAVLGVLLSTIVQSARETTPEIAKSAEETQELVQQLTREIRTTSYLLHPPLLDENGLPAALSWFLRGLTERSGLDISFNISEEFGRLPRDMELAVFRLVQECLTNVHRHSGSKSAVIQIFRESDRVLVEVRDHGKGIPPERLAEIQSKGSGVGIRGMRERLRQFHGDMNIHSTGAGTTILVAIPVPKEGRFPQGMKSLESAT
jgi:PAS domain S-box-containing protein